MQPKKFGPTGVVSIPYSFDNAPANGFDEMSFPIKIDEAPTRRAFYYAMQFKFVGGGNGSYTGIQPREPGKALVTFSAFGNGAVPVADNCRGGADGGKGVSCSKMIDFQFKYKYMITVKRDSKDAKTWRATIRNVTSKGEPIEIGAWKPRPSSKGIQGHHGGFVEFFARLSSCDDMLYTRGMFGWPTAKAGGKEYKGTIKKPHTYGKCKSVNFSTEQVKDGWHVQVGNKDKQRSADTGDDGGDLDDMVHDLPEDTSAD